MKTIMTNSSELALWVDLVRDAESASHQDLDETLESYLVFTLMQGQNRQDLGQVALAIPYLEGLTSLGQLREDRLRSVGDHCLLLAGLYPGRIKRRLVNIEYFVKLGISAYEALAEVAKEHKSLFQRLSSAFVKLMDVLHALRRQASEQWLEPMQAFDLWNATGSLEAKLALGTTAQPVMMQTPRKQ